MTWYDEFEALSDDIGQVNRYLSLALHNVPAADRKRVDRVNDAALIVFHVFAFEDFCRHYTTGTPKPRNRRKGEPWSDVLRRLSRKAASQRRLSRLLPELRQVDEVIMIRDLYAHRLGRRACLRVSRRAGPQLLQRYGFETDGRPADPAARWWPTRDASFSRCVAPLMRLAEKIRDHITP